VGYIKPDSALVRAATDLLSRHAGQAGGACASCGETSPCASARHAVEVRRAAGLPDTISASDPLVSDGADALSAPIAPSSFGAGFSGNSGFGDASAPALAVAGQSGVNSGSFGSRPVGLSKAAAE
jgi:hypothetical protein